MTGQRRYLDAAPKGRPSTAGSPFVAVAGNSVIIESLGARGPSGRLPERMARAWPSEGARQGGAAAAWGDGGAPGGSGGSKHGDPPAPPYARRGGAYQLRAGGKELLYQPAEHRAFHKGARERARHRAVRAARQRDAPHSRGPPAGERGGRDRGEGRRPARGLRQLRRVRRGAEPGGEHQPVRGDTAEHRRVHRPACRPIADSRGELRGLLPFRLLGEGRRGRDHVHGAEVPRMRCARDRRIGDLRAHELLVDAGRGGGL